MAYKIFFTEDALAELENILDFIRADNQSAAEEFGEALLDHIGLLREFPQIGTSVRMRPVIRKMIHSPIRIYYRVNEKKGLVEVLHFWHAARKEPRS